MAAILAATNTVATKVWDGSWAERAACRGLDLNLFFEDLQSTAKGTDPYGRAREVCGGCEDAVRRSCLATSIAEGLRSGFFGGAIPARRIELRKAAQRDGVDVTSAAHVYRFLNAAGR